jgi:hypothetical protein
MRVIVAPEHSQRLRHASRCADAELVTIIAQHTPVASDRRLALVLLQLAHHESLIANQFELISEQVTDIDAEVVPPGVEIHSGGRSELNGYIVSAAISSSTDV